MIKVNASILILFLTVIAFGCRQKNSLKIYPIDPEFNSRFLSGQGLNPNYFSKKEVFQYYELSDIEKMEPVQLLDSLQIFINQKYKARQLDGIQQLSVLFYQKSTFANYGKQVYESAKDNENGNLEGFSEELVARIWLERSKTDSNKFKRVALLYHKNKILKEQTDSLFLKLNRLKRIPLR